ncbi:hypothetical protein [Actinoallomurus sp. CA-150999]|uniref:hypothetical protein n=1 Tax=Actinoallomurus sp. CA-150999 TaxID=3239887 RepID=UPI003D909B17
MRVPRRTAGHGGPPDISLDALADALTALRTARSSSQGVYAGYDRDRPYSVEGVSDFAAGRGHHRGRIGEVPLEQILIGDRWFHRLPPGEAVRLGKKWILRPDPCGGERIGGARELAPAIRAVRPATVRSAREDGLRRYTVPLAPPLRSADPAVARIAAHMRHHGMLRITLDVWADDDLDVRRVRTHFRRLRSVRVMPFAVVTSEYRDFGIPVDIEEPAAEDVMPDPKPPPSCWGRRP